MIRPHHVLRTATSPLEATTRYILIISEDSTLLRVFHSIRLTRKLFVLRHFIHKRSTMAARYTSPVSSPPFFYSPTGGFYVIIDNVKYKPAGTDELHHFLTYKVPGPVLNKAGKPGKYQPLPRPDQPTQFYMAQLQLYGLEPASSKEAAKTALLGAIEGPGGLVMSEEVRTIHIGLAVEWENTALAELMEKKRLRKEMKTERTYKRHRDEDELVTKFEAPSSKKSKSEKVPFRENP